MESLSFLESDLRWVHLPTSDKTFLSRMEEIWKFTFQEWNSLLTMASDLRQWQEKNLQNLWPKEFLRHKSETLWKIEKQKLFTQLKSQIEPLKQKKSYRGFTPENIEAHLSWKEKDFGPIFLGTCPVASEKTRCCQLKTLDALRSCGFGCSYCSIQTFYTEGIVEADPKISEKISKIQLDPAKRWHIGTGQNSDSLLFGNQNGILDALLDLAYRHPNLVLEFKTKSKEISWFSKRSLPKNILFTWSLNTPVIIEKEELLTADLEQRLEAAQSMAQAGALIGFHLHPMVQYTGSTEDYQALAETLVTRFSPESVAMVSFGTLTFTKNVLRKIRSSKRSTKVLQMPLIETAGKFSYPLEIKETFFKNIYNSFLPWHEKVFFFLCMEDPSLWQPVFGKSYATNEDFETDMLDHYFFKIQSLSRKSQT